MGTRLADLRAREQRQPRRAGAVGFGFLAGRGLAARLLLRLRAAVVAYAFGLGGSASAVLISATADRCRTNFGSFG
jgi:hypothetical protein